MFHFQVYFDEGFFLLNIDVLTEDGEILNTWTKQICEYRLHVHFERKGK